MSLGRADVSVSGAPQQPPHAAASGAHSTRNQNPLAACRAGFPLGVWPAALSSGKRCCFYFLLLPPLPLCLADFRMYLGEQSPTSTLARGGDRRSRFLKSRSAILLAGRSSTSEDGSPHGAGPPGEADWPGGGARVGFQVGGATPAPPLACPTALAGIAAGPAAGAQLAARGISQPGGVTPGPTSPGFQPPSVAGPSGDASGMAGELSATSASAQPYVSTFGSLPPTLSGGSPQLQAILATHAPYMSKLESIASSATRQAPFRAVCRPERERCSRRGFSISKRLRRIQQTAGN